MCVAHTNPPAKNNLSFKTTITIVRDKRRIRGHNDNVPTAPSLGLFPKIGMCIIHQSSGQEPLSPSRSFKKAPESTRHHIDIPYLCMRLTKCGMATLWIPGSKSEQTFRGGTVVTRQRPVTFCQKQTIDFNLYIYKLLCSTRYKYWVGNGTVSKLE